MSEVLLEQVVEQLTVGVCVWQLGPGGEPANLVLRVCNSAAAAFLGVPRDAVLGKPIGEGFPGSLETPLPGVFAQVIESGEPAELGDVPYADEIVGEETFSIRVQPIGGRCALVEFTNVTTARQAEAEVERMLAEAARAREETERLLASTRDLDEKLALIEQQKREIQDLTAPILELWAGVLTLPLVGRFDDERNAVVREKLLNAIMTKQARKVVIDVTGLASIGEDIADELGRLSRACALLGAETYFSGISPTNARVIASLGEAEVALTGRCTRSLRDALGQILHSPAL